jgi:diaminohydroxyphosphoribosylaminopyrimidine deaminase/5-amino-6-(5-phosphoribosylamino)uracil reductase
MVTLKLATSLDGRIATASGQSQWITGDAARAAAHILRASHDAILVGSGTALADKPSLTVRLPGMEGRSPVRVVADGRLRLPLTSPLVASARDVPTWIAVLDEVPQDRRAAFEGAGVEILPLPAGPDHLLSMAALLGALGDRGITRVMVEGGGRLAAALLAAGLVDRVAWFRAPLVLGGDGVPAVGGLGLGAVDEGPRFVRVSSETLGPDTVEFFAQSA